MPDKQTSTPLTPNAEPIKKEAEPRPTESGFFRFSLEEKPTKRVTIAGSLVAIAAVVVILAGLKAAQTIIAPFFLSAFFAIVLIPPLRWLKEKGFSDVISFTIISSSVFITGIVVITIFAISANMFIDKIPEYQRKIGTTLSSIDDALEPFGLSLHGGVKEKELPKKADKTAVAAETEKTENTVTEPPKTEMVPDADETQEDESEEAIAEVEPAYPMDPQLHELRGSSPINTVGIIAFIQKGVTELCYLIGVAVLVLVMVVFMILEASRMPQKLLDAFGSKGIERSIEKDC